MADKRKYVSEFEIKSNVDEAVKQLQKYYVEFSKIPGVVEDFNKSLKKNAQLEKHFYDMMSAIPKTMKQLSEFSKLKLIPKKELERLTNTVQLIESASKNMGTFDKSGVSSLVNEFSKVTSELEAMDSRHSKIAEKSEAYNNLLGETSNLQKKLQGNVDKYKSSTEDISSSYTKVKRSLTTIANQLKDAPKDGVLSPSYIQKTNERLEIVRSKINKLDNEYNTVTSTIDKMSKSFDDVLETSKDISGSMKNSTAKKLYEDIVSEVSKMKDTFDDVVDKEDIQEKVSIDVLDTIGKINDKLIEQTDRLNEIASTESKLLSESKARNEALNYMNRLTGGIQEEMSNISTWNTAIKRQFEEQVGVVNKLRQDLEKTVLSEDASNEAIREKVGLLKVEAKKLDVIRDRQDEVKILEEQSISATVRRAKEQNEISKAYIKQTLSQKKNLGGLVDSAKNFKKNIPNKLTAKFGENGLVAAKALSGAFKMLGAVIAPVAGMFSVIGAIKLAFSLEKEIKSSRKQILMMAGDTNTLSDTFEGLSQGTNLVFSGIESMRAQTEKWAWSIGVTSEQAISYMNDFTKSGFKATQSLKNLEDYMAFAPVLGMEVSQLASSAGNLRAEFGMTLSDIGTSFIGMQKDAKNAGVTTTIFFDKVISAAVGLGLYGKRIDEVSSLFGGLVKNMKLPENAATDGAKKIVGSFKDLSNEAQIAIYRLGDGAKFWQKSYKDSTEKNSQEINELIAKEKSLERQIGNTTDEQAKKAKQAELGELRHQRSMIDSRQQMLDNTNSLKGVNAELEQGLNQNPAQQMLMQMNFLTKKFAGDIDITAPIQKVKDAIEKNVLSMKVGGESFGMDREVIETMRSIANNLSVNSNRLAESFKKRGDEEDLTEDIIEILSTSNNTADRQAKLTTLFGNTEKKDFKKVQEVLKESFPTLATDLSDLDKAEGNKLKDGLAKVVSTLDVNFAAMTNTETKIQAEEEKKRAKRIGIEALKQTRSTEDALNNVVGKLLRDIFVAIEKLIAIFEVVYGAELKASKEVIDSLNNNQSEILKYQDRIDTGMRDLSDEKELILNKEGPTTDEDKERLEQITKEQAKFSATQTLLDKFKENQKKQKEEFSKKGKLTDEFSSLSREAGSLSKILSNLETGSNLNLEAPRIQTHKMAVLGLPSHTVSEPVEWNKEKPIKQFGKTEPSPERSFSQGGIVPGNSFFGDKILSGLNSGEMVIPRKDWQNGGSQGMINDNRVINIYVNQNDRRQVEQVVLNALYTDKLKWR